MRLYSYFRSTSSYRVRLALALKRVDYEYVAVNLSPAVLAQNEPSFERKSPMRQVPVLEWTEGDQVHRLTQSVAIIEYLEARFPEPALFPTDPLRLARCREAVEIVNSGIQPLHNSAALALLRAEVGPAFAEQWARQAIQRGLTALEALAQAAAPVGFFLGKHPSVADVFIVPQLYAARRYGVELAPFQRLVTIDELAQSHAAFDAAAPDRQPDAPGAIARAGEGTAA